MRCSQHFLYYAALYLGGLTEQTQSSDSAATSQHKRSHEGPIPVSESGRLPSSSGESQPMVYAQLNVMQTQVPSPTSVDPVQYALIKHQDKL